MLKRILLTSIMLTLYFCVQTKEKSKLDPNSSVGFFIHNQLCGSFSICPPEIPKNYTMYRFYFQKPISVSQIIDNQIYLKVPFDTDITSLVAFYETDSKKVMINDIEQISGETPNDFSKEVEYKLYAYNDSVNTYRVHVSKTPISSKSITSFWLEEPKVSGVLLDNTIILPLPFGTNPSSLKACFITTGSFVQVNNIKQVSCQTTNNFISPLEYTVFALDGSSTAYTINAQLNQSDSKEMLYFSFPSIGAVGVVSNSQISIEIPENTKLDKLIAKFSHTGNVVKVSGIEQESEKTANDFRNKITYSVYAYNGSQKDYSIVLKYPQIDSNDILSFSLQSPPVSGTIHGMDIIIITPPNTDKTKLIPVFQTNGVKATIKGTIQISGISTVNFSVPIYYNVYSKNGNIKTYKVTVN